MDSSAYYVSMLDRMILEGTYMTMDATVIRTEQRRLLVRDSQSGNEVMVNFNNARRFSSGDHVRITHNGIMTNSIPPQITATAIQRIPAPPTPPAEIRAVILQRSHNSLLVRDMRDGRQIRVNYPFAYHFCVRQQIVVKHDAITMDNPPRVEAKDIIPIC